MRYSLLMNANKLAVVTGGEGFVGSHLCERLVKEGYRVISLDNKFTGECRADIPTVEYRTGHTKDIAQMVPETPDLLYHLGEYARVEQSMLEPDVVWSLNVQGTFAVLEFWRSRAGKTKLIYAGSSTKFADGGLGRDLSPYTWTKATNTELVRNYAHWYGLPFAITYFYNVYGPGEHKGKYGTVIEIFRQLYLAGNPITVRAPGVQRRIFTHVHDIVNGLVLVGEKGDGDEFGLGADKDYSVLEVAQLFGSSIEMIPDRPGNRITPAIDTTKSRAIGWSPKHDVTDYIKEIVATKK